MPRKWILDGTFSEPPQRLTPSSYLSFQHMSEANYVQWVYAVVHSLISCHLLGRAQDWYQIFGSTLEQNSAMDFVQLKRALSEAFPVIRNKDLEVKFYASQQRREQAPK
ncbi:uncharacterized protein TNCV_5084041 [Trichonephila clavipes]|nr:uncharacterized protein TNCV_5084041 [Trichonephila clavipes]